MYGYLFGFYCFLFLAGAESRRSCKPKFTPRMCSKYKISLFIYDMGNGICASCNMPTRNACISENGRKFGILCVRGVRYSQQS